MVTVNCYDGLDKLPKLNSEIFKSYFLFFLFRARLFLLRTLFWLSLHICVFFLNTKKKKRKKKEKINFFLLL